ncbi:prolipoprotein diacylglyceryl transferase family protein [Deminuibacter soli]|uniref:Prolipoprotein diacylglyceryl transferase n=1 Tax=Deminuibacter soli TaxID=2291815 RepID=A0A3E1NGH9_9BACT|nr:prolipoprotein diacylglyceryl transferase family protein [Deminuibacter soli]RFM26951.1 hypothetical protein DXN05_18375 [Deminuibacter soli]
MKPSTHIKLGTRKIPAFHFFGTVGFTAGLLLGVLWCIALHLPVWGMLVMALTAMVAFTVLAMLAKLLTGEEIIVYYHHEIAILLGCALVLGLLHQPVLRFLDIMILCIATFLAFGRLGCFSAGCCHGKPFKKGVVYTHAHVQEGLIYYYENVPLFPVQLAESLYVSCIVLTGCWLLSSGAAPGSVLVLYTAGYGLCRYVMEFFRGDPWRPYWQGLSEAQWTTLLLVLFTWMAGYLHWLPLYTWHTVIAAALLCSSAVVVFRFHKGGDVVNPRIIRQLMNALHQAHLQNLQTNSVQQPAHIHVCANRQGWKVSAGLVQQYHLQLTHYTISGSARLRLTHELAEKLAQLLQTLHAHTDKAEITGHPGNLFHIVFKTPLPDSKPAAYHTV